MPALFSALRCCAVLSWGCGGGEGPGLAGWAAGLPGQDSTEPAVLWARHPAAVSHLPNKAGFWLLGQLISRGLFVLHTLMLFNSKFLIKWKVLLEAREQQLQQDPACRTDLAQRSTVRRRRQGLGAHVSAWVSGVGRHPRLAALLPSVTCLPEDGREQFEEE